MNKFSIIVCFSLLNTAAHAIAQRISNEKEKIMQCEPASEYISDSVDPEKITRYIVSDGPKMFRALLVTKQNDISELEKALIGGGNSNECFMGMSILNIASMRESTDAAQLLLKYGANANFPLDATGYSPLSHATSMKKFDAANLLIENGADVNFISENNDTVLHMLVLASNFAHVKKPKTNSDLQKDSNDESKVFSLFQKLMAAGINVNQKNNQGYTALHYAVINRNYKLVRLLLENHADSSLKSHKGKTALDLAIERKASQEIIEILKQYTSP